MAARGSPAGDGEDRVTAPLTRAELEAAIRECIAKGLFEPGSTPERIRFRRDRAEVVR